MMPDAVTLTRNPLGCLLVDHRGQRIGWLFPTSGDQWRAYQRVTTYNTGTRTGRLLGSFNQDDGIRAILRAAGATPPEVTPL